ncbi:MAG TPA: PPOX class F420-dependent oxidoreductase [Ktedonobacterales bacterium]|nr:PPOX class F420-dependent oxidoreductase [Ktedonobacterales bacterium]
MSRFTPAEIAYLQAHRLGRLATVSETGDPHVVPVAYRYDAGEEAIDIGGHGLVTSRKYREALRHGRVAFVVDDRSPAGGPRLIEIRGTARSLAAGGAAINPGNPPDILRITPTYIVSLGVNDDEAHPREGRLRYHGRAVE